MILLTLAFALNAQTKPDPADRCRKLPGQVHTAGMDCKWVLHKDNKFERYYRCECRVSDVNDPSAPSELYLVDFE